MAEATILDLPALDVEPTPISINGDLATLGSAAALGRAGLPAHAGMRLSRLRADQLAASHGEERCRENKRAIHGCCPIVENRWSAAKNKGRVELYSRPGGVEGNSIPIIARRWRCLLLMIDSVCNIALRDANERPEDPYEKYGEASWRLILESMYLRSV